MMPASVHIVDVVAQVPSLEAVPLFVEGEIGGGKGKEDDFPRIANGAT